jgi:hypothetical protein
MTLTQAQFGVLIGAMTSAILVLVVLCFYLVNQVRFYRHRFYDARADVREQEYEKIILKQEYDTLVFMRDKAESDELTPDELDYLHRTLGISIPAQRSNSDGLPSTLME